MNLKTMLAPHPAAAIEYWFFKVNAGPIALLVDWIARRRDKENWLRVSIHSPHKREVLFEKRVELMAQDNFLNMHRTVGSLDDIAWELHCDPGNTMLKPDIFPFVLLGMPDVVLVSAPDVHFNGWIRHGGQTFTLQDARGMISHYWGRQLTWEWWWISANQFEREDVSVECVFARTRLWGTSLKTAFAYLYLRQKEMKEFSMVLPGFASVKGSSEQFELTIKRIGKEPVILIGTGHEYGGLGDRIVNTLTGDLEIRVGNKLIAKARGTAGLEYRSPY